MFLEWKQGYLNKSVGTIYILNISSLYLISYVFSVLYNLNYNYCHQSPYIECYKLIAVYTLYYYSNVTP